MSLRRAAAVVSLVLAAISVVVAAVTAVINFPRGLIVLALVVVALATAWTGVLHRGPPRALGLAVSVACLIAALILLFGQDPIATVISVVSALGALAVARAAFAVHVHLPAAPPPKHPVLIFNPRSGGGKAVRFDLANEARSRGIEPVELSPGTRLEELIEAAVAGGADALAMAGGDGTQALGAAAAARAGIPFACIPAGTRNHFALDLGVDRKDVVGALDAFVDGGEREVDLAEVNGRVFVNNVSLGIYADAVQRTGYREAKLRTLLDTVPEVVGPRAQTPPLRWRDPDGLVHEGGVAVLVSNNPYRLGHVVGSGTRPRLDSGSLGVAVLGTRGAISKGLLRLWNVASVEVDGDDGVPAGIDGEAVLLDPPLRFVSRPAALRVRIASQHPGASPAAAIPDSAWAGVRALTRIAVKGAAEPPRLPSGSSPRQTAGERPD